MKSEMEICCNMCGKKIAQKQDMLMEDFASVKKSWGYFSKKDGTVQEFDLCEACWDALLRRFQIPVTETELKEML